MTIPLVRPRRRQRPGVAGGTRHDVRCHAIEELVRRALPDNVRVRVPQFFGDAGREWLAALPEAVARLADRWGLELSDRRYGGGTHSLVLAATRADGSPALLKLPALDDENRMEGAALRRYGGDGAALLYAADPATGALLMERLEPGSPLGNQPDQEAAVDVAAALLRRLSRPVAGGHPFPLVSDLVARWSVEIPADQERHGALTPAEMRAVAAALGTLRARAGPLLLVNRDGHMDNILAAEREPWLLIDPKPLAGEAAFDGGWLLIDALRPSITAEAALRHSARIGAGLGVPPERVRAWALVRAADNVFWELDAGDEDGVSRALVAVLSAAA